MDDSVVESEGGGVAAVFESEAELAQLMSGFAEQASLRDALASSDLRAYARAVELELAAAERAAVADYAAQAAAFAEAHAQIRSCDAVLAQMEALLGGFQTHLGAISAEIRHLQEESSALSVKLANRQAVSTQVGEFVASTVIPEAMAKEICEAQVGEAYLEYLVELNRRSDFVASMTKKGAAPLAVTEVAPVLLKLEHKAVAKIREFLLQRIHSLKKPRTNLQMIQHNILSKFKYMNVFLQAHAPAVFEEVQNQYVEVLSKVYGSFFKAYLAGLARLELPVGTKFDLLGIEPERQKSWTDKFVTSRAPTANVFALGSRAQVLAQMDADLIVPHEAAEKSTRFSYDVLFRSLHHYLLDSVTSEWLFCMEWFGPNDLFPKIFSVPLQQCLATVSTSVKGSFDSVGLLIMLRITALNKLTMVRRGIPVLVSYFQKLDALLLPRLLELIQQHVASVKAIQVVPGSVELKPHFVVRRFADLLVALETLTSDFPHPDVLGGIAQLVDEVLGLLDRMCAAVPDRRQRRVFALVNLDVAASLAREREAGSGAGSARVQARLDAEMNSFAAEMLNACCPALFEAGREKTGKLPADKESVENLLRAVHKSWKADVAKLVQGSVGGFSNFALAGAICRKILFDLTRTNTRVWDLVKEAYGPNAFSKFYVAPFQLRDEFAAAMKAVGLLLDV